MWAGKGRDRGLSSWGERVPKKSAGRPKRWEVPSICRQIIMQALDFYSDTIGLPPVVSGVPPSTPRSKKKKKKSKTGRGFQKNTPELVRGPKESTIDVLSTFVFSLHTYYCLHLNPPVDEGSDSEIAVFKTLMGDNCKTHLLRSMKTRFQKWTNKSLVVACVPELHTWVRSGPKGSKKERVECLKALTRSSTSPDDDGRTCQSLVVKALVQYSRGKEGAKVWPYGDKAHNTTGGFKKISSPTFAVTLSCMYPFIVEDKSKWDSLLGKSMYPIKQLWPKGVICRFMNFNQAFHTNRKDIFDSYQASGGTFHGDTGGSSDDEPSNEDAEDVGYEDAELDCDKDFL